MVSYFNTNFVLGCDAWKKHDNKLFFWHRPKYAPLIYYYVIYRTLETAKLFILLLKYIILTSLLWMRHAGSTCMRSGAARTMAVII